MKNAEFVSRMEDILAVYKRPYDPKKPLVCLDESSKQQVKEIRIPLSMEPGKSERFDTFGRRKKVILYGYDR
ncbi:MAG: hypothetical protein ACI9F2_000372 [Lysobacterales bacterium]|jgi:hypothetical protein